jgi:putative acetyltransferase
MNPAVTLRPYRADDLLAIAQLFHATVHEVNCRDYSPVQLDAWAPANADLDRWRKKLAGEDVIVAEQAGALVGFCSWDPTGYLDFLFVHPAQLRQGVASLLYAAAEAAMRAKALPRIHAQVSVTAQPFFLRQGFRVVKHQVVQARGVDLQNAVMEKLLQI